ncbi:MAG: sulfotransferase, partial [Actinomycetota bacterium]|nr:sulfotransferase [Actinomycetota bacterium]
IEERRPSSRFVTYSEMTAALYEAIRDVSGISVIVDSSKKPIRTYGLLANPRLDVRVIHIVRDGRGVVWSRLKSSSRDVEAGVRSDRQPTRPVRSTFHWVLANLESEWVAKRAGANKTVRVAYESFVEHPDQVLRQISRVLGEDLSPLVERVTNGEAMDPGHLVGGNRVRMSGRVALRPDLEWKVKLPSTEAKTFWRLAGWLARRYGYTR